MPKVILSSLLRCLILPCLLAGLAHAEVASPVPLRILVNPGDHGEQSRALAYGNWRAALEQALRKERIANVTVALSNDATADLGATRSNIHDIFVAPAHVIGSAVRYGYTPVLALDPPVQAVLVAPKESAIGNLAQASGKRLGLPLQDSVVTYLLRGEVNAANTSIRRHFGSVYETRYQDALLTCLQVRHCDLVAVERSVFDRWLAAGEQLKVVMESKPVPGLSVAIRNGVRPGADALKAALTETLGANGLLRSEKGRVVSLTAGNFDYVATLGYFTPRILPGASVVDAHTVAQLMQRGASLVDTRNDAEYKAGHLPGAALVPYVEKSAKEADFDAKLDQFDLSKLTKDRRADLIFSCNGPECWKSFKASHAAIKAGYSKVYWFRGGFPEWRGAGMEVKSEN
jgi:rhodanese-related sulfurtransferase/ABC-type phosphate/phosphonate transport system substrate-binding protein